MECRGYAAGEGIWALALRLFLRAALGRNFLITLGEMRFGEIKRAVHCKYCVLIVAERETNVITVA